MKIVLFALLIVSNAFAGWLNVDSVNVKQKWRNKKLNTDALLYVKSSDSLLDTCNIYFNSGLKYIGLGGSPGYPFHVYGDSYFENTIQLLGTFTGEDDATFEKNIWVADTVKIEYGASDKFWLFGSKSGPATASEYTQIATTLSSYPGLSDRSLTIQTPSNTANHSVAFVGGTTGKITAEIFDTTLFKTFTDSNYMDGNCEINGDLTVNGSITGFALPSSGTFDTLTVNDSLYVGGNTTINNGNLIVNGGTHTTEFTGNNVNFKRDGGTYITAVNGPSSSLSLQANAYVRLQIDGVEIFRADSFNNVGIGTPDPEGKLHVLSASAGTVTANSAADELILENNGQCGMSILTPAASQSVISFGTEDDSYSAALVYNDNDSIFTIGTRLTGGQVSIASADNSESIRIDENGNVGINTSSPEATLQVIHGTTAGGANQGGVRIGRTSSQYWDFSGDAAHNYLTTGIKPGNIGTHDATSFNLRTNNAIALSIDTNQNIGIGTTSPQQPIHLRNSAPIIRIEDSDNGIYSEINQNTGAGAMAIGADVAGIGSNPSLDFRIRDDSKIKIDSGGNVGIGTTSPSHKLDVDGSIEYSDYSRHFDDYSVPTATNVPIYIYDGNYSMNSSHSYQVTLRTLLTGTMTGAKYLVEYDGSGFVSHLVSAEGIGSNHPLLTISGSTMYVYHNHASTYTIRATVERLDGGNAANASNHTWGAEAILTVLGNDLGVDKSNLESWLNTMTALQVGGNSSVASTSTEGVASRLYLINNMYRDATDWKTLTTDESSMILLGDGNIDFYTYENSTADAAFTPVNRMRIDEDGNVGIGINTPQRLLHLMDTISSQVGITIRSNDTAIGIVEFNDGGGEGAIIYDHSDDYMAFKCNGSNRATIVSNGNVGIGTDSPTSKLDVNGSMSVGGRVASTYDNSDTYSSTGQPIHQLSINNSNNASGGYANINFNIAGTSGTGSYYLGAVGNSVNSGAELFVGHRTGSSTYNEVLRIDSDGYVGLGTTTPDAILDVNGDRMIIENSNTPASASATGTAGTICWDANYIYICTATDTWKRTAISSW